MEQFLRSAEHHPAVWQRQSPLTPSLLTSSGWQNLGQQEEIHRRTRPTFGRWQRLTLSSYRTEFSTQPKGAPKTPVAVGFAEVALCFLRSWQGVQGCQHSLGSGSEGGCLEILIITHLSLEIPCVASETKQWGRGLLLVVGLPCSGMGLRLSHAPQAAAHAPALWHAKCSQPSCQASLNWKRDLTFMKMVIIISTSSGKKKKKSPIQSFHPVSFSWNDRSSMCRASNTPVVSLYISVTSSQAHKTQSLVLSRLSFFQPPSPTLSLAQGHADYFFDSAACSKVFAIFSLAVSDLGAPTSRRALRCTLKTRQYVVSWKIFWIKVPFITTVLKYPGLFEGMRCLNIPLP